MVEGESNLRSDINMVTEAVVEKQHAQEGVTRELMQGKEVVVEKENAEDVMRSEVIKGKEAMVEVEVEKDLSTNTPKGKEKVVETQCRVDFCWRTMTTYLLRRESGGRLDGWWHGHH
ncbi:unnamed protein product [Cuscuta europaea]|uniref:Uncharacterized protein n=1 Tax=Cuscuta europaea TaxID=41803 RepID=A0A9P0VSL4_CUSEU|nr:unnamed protein product [Cuscuta europaea]